MRGGDSLMFWISRLNGVIWNICHSSNCIRQPTVRCPSSVFFGNRFRSADCQKIQLPLGGSQGEETIRLQQPTEYTPSASHSLSSSLREGAKGTSCQRAGQGTNVLVQALCVIVRRHCRPGGFGSCRIGTRFVASLKKPPAGKQAAFWIYRVSLEDRYLRTISATLNTMAWSN